MNIDKMLKEAKELAAEIGKDFDEAQKKVQAARSRVILSHRFIAALALRMPCIPDGRCPTMWTDGNVIGYNPLFVKQLTIPEIVGVTAHEVWHTVLMHHLRRGNRNPMVWNMAADYGVNLIITAGSEAFTLPEVNLCESRFRDMGCEKVYDILLAENPPPPQDEEGDSKPCDGGKGGDGEGAEGDGKDSKDSDPGNCGEVRDWTPKDNAPDTKPKKPSKAEMSEAEATMKRHIIQAATAAKMCGTLPGNIARLVAEATAPKTNALEVISSWATELARDDWSWRRPNRRYHDSPFILPSLRSENPGTCGFFIDTSGSMSEKELNEAASELQGILRRDNLKVQIIYCDSQVAKTQEITPEDMPLKLKMYGGGGTDFRPPFDWVKEKDITLSGAVYFTDGYCNSFPEPPDYPVLWILSSSAGSWGSSNFSPPFGIVIKMPTHE